MGLVSPLGCTVQSFWDRATRGVSGVRPITCFDAAAFDSRIAGQAIEFNVDDFIPQ